MEKWSIARGGPLDLRCTLFCKEPLLRSLHADSRKILRTHSTNGKKAKELFNFKAFVTANNQELGNRFYSFTTKTHTDSFISIFPSLFVSLF